MKTVKILLVAAFAFASTALFAQKMARIDYQGTLMAMPEMATVNTDLEKVAADYQEAIESLNVERSKLMDELTKLPETTTETARQLKNRGLVEINQRIEEYYQVAQEGIAKAQNDLVLPLKTKLDAAIKKVCKAQSIVVAYQIVPAEAFSSEVVYIDDALVDITPAVRTELGIAAN